MSDLLSTFLAGEITETYVKKIYNLMSIVIVFALIWTAINLLGLYKFTYNAPPLSRLSHPFYQYIIAPLVAIAGLALNLMWLVLLYKAWGNLKTYLETSDDTLLHKGLKTFYTSTTLLVVWFVIFIIDASYRTFIL